MPAAPSHLAAIEAVAERSAPRFPVVQAMHFSLEAECPAPLEYRRVTSKNQKQFTNIAVWAPEPAPTTFGEPGDLWVNIKTFNMFVCQEDHAWVDVPEDEDHAFASIHPIFPDLALTFNGMTIQWFRKTTRNKARRDLRDLMPSLPPQSTVLSTFWRKIESHISTTPPSKDPAVYHSSPPSNILQHSKYRQLFPNPMEFMKLVSDTSSSQSEATPGGGDSQFQVDLGEFEGQIRCPLCA